MLGFGRRWKITLLCRLGRFLFLLVLLLFIWKIGNIHTYLFTFFAQGSVRFLFRTSRPFCVLKSWFVTLPACWPLLSVVQSDSSYTFSPRVVFDFSNLSKICFPIWPFFFPFFPSSSSSSGLWARARRSFGAVRDGFGDRLRARVLLLSWRLVGG